jgi:predicted RNase H-like HicB family nuclease
MARKMRIPDKYREQAEELAFRPYSIVFKQDETTDGKPIMLALNPELPGCMSHGADSIEAFENLKKARIDYIQNLLAKGFSVPPPAKFASETGQAFSTEPIVTSYDSLTKSEDEPSEQETLIVTWVGVGG